MERRSRKGTVDAQKDCVDFVEFYCIKNPLYDHAIVLVIDVDVDDDDDDDDAVFCGNSSCDTVHNTRRLISMAYSLRVVLMVY
jgi:hypothetical protein